MTTQLPLIAQVNVCYGSHAPCWMIDKGRWFNKGAAGTLVFPQNWLGYLSPYFTKLLMPILSTIATNTLMGWKKVVICATNIVEFEQFIWNLSQSHSSHGIQSKYSPSLHGTGVGGQGHIGWVIPGSGLWKWSGAGGVDKLLQLPPGPAYAPNKSEYGEPETVKPSHIFIMSTIYHHNRI